MSIHINKQDEIRGAEELVTPSHPFLQYSGRIDFEKKEEPMLVFPCSYIRITFKGSSISVILKNHHEYWDNYIGWMLDGQQYKHKLERQKVEHIVLGNELDQTIEHEVLLFKRMDSCHTVTFYGFSIGGKAEVLKSAPLSGRRIEVYGDSVSAGEVSEALDCVGKPDPDHQGEYSNSWYSYAWMTARNLNAQLHNISQGGVALLNGTGWYHPPEYVGMEQIFDKICYNEALGTITRWDFGKYRPHVVIVAIGQNDSHPNDVMKEDYDGAESRYWRLHYEAFVRKIRMIYPKAHVILATTVLNHDESWDRAIEEVSQKLDDKKVHHMMYKENGCKTPGHIRIPEAKQMAEELTEFILALGEEIWNE